MDKEKGIREKVVESGKAQVERFKKFKISRKTTLT
jgi:hypothetical protein